MSTKRILSILLGYVFILCFPSHAKAWDEETLRALALDALQLAPTEMKTFLERHKDHILDGVAWPHRHLLRGLDDPHEAHDPVQHAATHLQRERVGILQEWNKPQPNEIWIAGRMGTMAHYIGDILRPQRFSARASHVHTRDMLKNYDIFVFYEGPEVVEDFPSHAKHWRQWVLSLEDRAALDTLIYHTAANAILNSWMTAWKRGGVPLTGVLSSGTVIHRKKLDVHLRALTPAEQREFKQQNADRILGMGLDRLREMQSEQDKAFDRGDFKRVRKIEREKERTADDAILDASREVNKPIEYRKTSDQYYSPPQRSVVKLLEFSLRTVGSSAKAIGRIYNGTQQESGKVMLDVALFSKQGQPLGLHQIEILPDPLGAGRIKTFTFELKSPPFEAYKVGIRKSQ